MWIVSDVTKRGYAWQNDETFREYEIVEARSRIDSERIELVSKLAKLWIGCFFTIWIYEKHTVCQISNWLHWTLFVLNKLCEDLTDS